MSGQPTEAGLYRIPLADPAAGPVETLSAWTGGVGESAVDTHPARPGRIALFDMPPVDPMDWMGGNIGISEDAGRSWRRILPEGRLHAVLALVGEYLR